MFGLRKKIKQLEKRVESLEAAQRADSYRYGVVTLQDLVKIVEKIPSEKPTAKK